MRNSRACESCRASKNRCVFKDDSTTCQRCEQAKSRCAVRDKARPRRVRGAKTTRSQSNPKLSNSPSIPGSPVPEGEFSINLPTTIYHDPARDVEALNDHHKLVFSEDASPIPSKSTVPPSTKTLSPRRLTLHQATHLLEKFLPALPFFPFITLPNPPTIQNLSQQSPFLLLAMLTISSIPHPYLHHQIDHEFRRILSLKIVAEHQKSLDYLLGLLAYIAWYPMHTKPKSNPCFMYMNLAVSLATDMELDQKQPGSSPFQETDMKGLVDESGAWTEQAKLAWMGCYVLSSTLSQSFHKPQNLSFNDDTAIGVDQAAMSITTLQRLTERISSTWDPKNTPEMDPFNTELHIQLYTSELDSWRRNTPDTIVNSPLISLHQKFTHCYLYSQALHLLNHRYKPYPFHCPHSTTRSPPSPQHLNTLLTLCISYLNCLLSIPPTHYTHFSLLHWSTVVHTIVTITRCTFLLARVENWSAETTREKVGLSMFLEALCFRLEGLSSSIQTDEYYTPRRENPKEQAGGGKTNTGPKPLANGDTDADAKGNGQKYTFYHVLAEMLNSVKVSWEKRVKALVPIQIPVASAIPTSLSRLLPFSTQTLDTGIGMEQTPISRGRCPIYDPAMTLLFEGVDFDLDFGSGVWDGVTAGGGMDGDVQWDANAETGLGYMDTGNVSLGEVSETPTTTGLDTPSSGNVENMGAGTKVASMPYHDLWATMTGSWADMDMDMERGWSMGGATRNVGAGGDGADML